LRPHADSAFQAAKRSERSAVGAASGVATAHAVYPVAAGSSQWSSLGRLGMLIVLVALGVATYIAALQALGVAKFGDFATALRARKKAPG